MVHADSHSAQVEAGRALTTENNDEKSMDNPKTPSSRSHNRKCLKPGGKYFKEYCEHSSLHGLQYLVEDGRSCRERLCWVVALVLCFTACTMLILQLWYKWDITPVTVTFSEMSVPVSQIPFPAVTICSELKVDKTKFNLKEVARRQSEATEYEKKALESLKNICEFRDEIWISNETTTEENINILFDVGITCADLKLDCSFPGLALICEDNIYTILTETGICCSFNMLAPEDMFTDGMIYPNSELNDWTRVNGWDLEKGYNEEAGSMNDPLYPRRSVRDGNVGGLELVAMINLSVGDSTCSRGSQGYKIALHNPAEFPNVGEKYIRVPMEGNFVMGLKPTQFITDENVLRYPPEKRGCYLSNERKLRVFKTYTQQNCEFECWVNATMQTCGCALLYMPRDNATPYCSSEDWSCIYGIGEEYDVVKTCKCLPSCTEIEYNAETSYASIDAAVVADNYDVEDENTKISKVEIFYKELEFIARHRIELYGFIDFLANCGGILGLCLGFSVLSLVEIVYFLTIRLATRTGLLPECRCRNRQNTQETSHPLMTLK